MQLPTSDDASGFLSVSDPEELAVFLGTTYVELGKVLYGWPDRYKYRTFSIRKRGGGHRTIQAPCKKLKDTQRCLSTVLYQLTKPHWAAHGFALNRSIVTNARRHLNRGAILNVDLEDFFGTINFGRVRGLFMARPFSFTPEVATVLARLCCHNNALPQGAPTSPVVANMIAYRLDRELSSLAGARATYTRYADDISFSFHGGRELIPRDFVVPTREGFVLGESLVDTVRRNGFTINERKTRLADKNSRMSVTGITVNESPNVLRRHVRQVRSMLYAWDTHGLRDAADHFTERYDQAHRATAHVKSFPHVVHGRLLFLRHVRGIRDEIYCRAAVKFNALASRDGLSLRLTVVAPVAGPRNAGESLWVTETKEGIQGTAFSLWNHGLITCLHCTLTDSGRMLGEIEVFRCDDPTNRRKVSVVRRDTDRDLALCLPMDGQDCCGVSLDLSRASVEHDTKGRLFGFPAYTEGSRESIANVTVTNPNLIRPDGVRRFVIDQTIHHGASGAPILDADAKVIGVAVEGAVSVFAGTTLGGRNTAVHVDELRHFLRC